MAKNLNYLTETHMLRKVANDTRCRWHITKHALEELKKDGRAVHDLQYLCMTNGQVTLHELKRDLLWRVEGTDIDGKRMQAIVAVFEMAIKIKVITAF